eukprot:2911217-Ditylum_brightwellii.AAC.1
MKIVENGESCNNIIVLPPIPFHTTYALKSPLVMSRNSNILLDCICGVDRLVQHFTTGYHEGKS